MKNVVLCIAGCLTCFLIVAFTEGTNPDRDVSFYETNLVCGAAHDIGCGTRAKPILADFMEHEEVEEAWLNHAGTVIAVVWKKELSKGKEEIVSMVFANHDLAFLEVTGVDKAGQLASFEEGKWYKGNDVDQLSDIEAGRIADQLTSWLDSELDVDDETKDQIHEAFETYVNKELKAITDANVINQTSYWKRWERELTAIGREYIGDDMPQVQIVSSSSGEECTTGKSCCTKEGSKDCCKKKGT